MSAMVLKQRPDDSPARSDVVWRILLGLLFLAGLFFVLPRTKQRKALASQALDWSTISEPRLASWIAAIVVAAAVVAAGYVVKDWNANFMQEAQIEQQTGGDASRAIPAMISNGCGGCHEIPGVPGARGTVGPSLEGVGRRFYIGGKARTSTDAMIRWIGHARDVDPGTAMPNTDLSPQDARDIAAYLYART
ncbi:c-type cytochrome [Mesorhizobium sp. ORM8.1]